MNTLRALGALLLVAGVALAILGIINGDLQVGLALFFIPYLYGSTAMGALAILLAFGGVLLLLMGGSLHGASPLDETAPHDPSTGRDQGRKEFGGVVLIGPVPIIFGSSHRSALWALLLGAGAVMALMLALLLL